MSNREGGSLGGSERPQDELRFKIRVRLAQTTTDKP